MEQQLDIIKRIHLIARASAVAMTEEKREEVNACIMRSNRMVELHAGLERILGQESQAIIM